MSINLSEILGLVGPLDDAVGDQTPRERFRNYLTDKVKEIGPVRDYVEECLRTSGDQNNRALQDLVNYIGQFLGFKITFGRYRGVQGEIGFDGHWQSPTGFHVVVEVKTTEVYAVKLATLMGYIAGLISDKKIPDWTSALGLYVIGRPDRELRQLENAIVAEKSGHLLRIVSVESLLSLAELMTEYGLSHENVLALLRPSGPSVDAIIDLIAQINGGQPEPLPEETAKQTRTVAASSIPEPAPAKTDDQALPSYWLTSVKSDDQETAEEIINRLVGEAKVYHFGLRAPGMRRMKPDDWICFYAAGKGVVAHAAIVSAPTQEQDNRARDIENFPWRVRLAGPVLYLDRPVVLNAERRRRLDAFKGGDFERWGFFVHGTRKLTRHDYEELTRQPT